MDLDIKVYISRNYFLQRSINHKKYQKVSFCAKNTPEEPMDKNNSI
jgi:hypothetical protein